MERSLKSSRASMREAGELLAVEAIYRTGLVVRSDGALVRVLRVFPPNPLVMSETARSELATSFCHLAGRLRPNQSLQYYVAARPVGLDAVLAECRDEVETWAGPAPTRDRRATDARGLDRWRLCAAMEQSIRLHADEQAAVDLGTYVIVPFRPPRRQSKALLDEVKRLGRSAPVLERDERAHRRAVRDSMAHVDQIRGELTAMGIRSRLLSGEQVVDLLWSRFNPSSADRRSVPSLGPEVLGELDAKRDRDEARSVAMKLREAIAASPIDFADARHMVVERDLEQTICAASTADGTHFGWLLGAMVACQQPYHLSVHVHALDRHRERQRLKHSYRRRFMLNRDREGKGRAPDFDAYQAEREQQQLLAEMSGHERAGIFRLSIYHGVRVPGRPEPDVGTLSEAVDQVAEHLSSASDCRIDAGKYQQQELWRSNLPLGDDVAQRARKYATRNIGDSTPLMSTSVGSAEGIPFAFASPGRTLERWNPRERAHLTQSTLITGRSGSGKTVACQSLLARSIALGARGFVIDRSGGYRTLAQLIDGAQHFDIGIDGGCALNPWDVDDVSRVPREKVAFLLALHETMLTEGLTTLERAQVGPAIRAVYQRCHLEGLVPRESLLVDELQDRAAAEQDGGSNEIAWVLRSLAERLREFVGDGAHAHVADRESTHLPDAPLLVFDTESCPEAVIQPVLFTALEFVRRTAAKHRAAHQRLIAQADAPLLAGCSILVGDEFWAFVRGALGQYANDLARRLRRLGLTLLVASQQLTDLDNEQGRALVANSTQQIFLGQHLRELEAMRRQLALSDEEEQLISQLRTVKGAYSEAFWVNGDIGRGKIVLPLGAIEYWAYTSEPLRDVPLRDQKIAEHGGDVWAAVYDLADHRPPSAGEQLIPTRGAA